MEIFFGLIFLLTVLIFKRQVVCQAIVVASLLFTSQQKRNTVLIAATGLPHQGLMDAASHRKSSWLSVSQI